MKKDNICEYCKEALGCCICDELNSTRVPPKVEFKAMKNKLVLEGELFTIIEEDDEGIHVCAEINGINLWDWLVQNNGNKIKLVIEEKI